MSLYPHKLPCKANTCIVGLTLAVNLGGVAVNLGGLGGVAGDTKWGLTSMTAFETIKNRRSIGKMTEHRPTRKQIAQILEAATHAPNHHKVEPWKFFVLAGKSRADLGEVMAKALAERLGDVTNDKAQAMLNKERTKLLRSPVVIVAVAESPQQSNVLAIENIEAVAAAVQNMLLTAEELGLAAMWRTGDAAYDPHIKQWLGLSPADHVVAFVYLGFPAIQKLERRPTSFEEKTTWLDWEN
jgi:nitroreductase